MHVEQVSHPNSVGESMTVTCPWSAFVSTPHSMPYSAMNEPLTVALAAAERPD